MRTAMSASRRNEILGAVGEVELKGDLRMALGEFREDRGQDLRADHLAGGDAHSARSISSHLAEAARPIASAALAMASAIGTSDRAVSVGASPCGERTKRGAASVASNWSRWRPSVGWVSPKARAAPDKLR